MTRVLAEDVMTEEEISASRARAREGAEYLDEHRPGWFNSVHEETLELASQCDCVLGQLYGNYIAGLNCLSSSTDSVFPMRYGFTFVNDEAEFDVLEDQWLKEIAARKARENAR